jgi:hypothetical protein
MSRRKSMPKVGKKHYSYTAKGRAAARKQARKTGQKVTNKRKKY